ncbi:hypothetical protein Tco_0582900 [Tanacetum coccineum]
MNMWYYKRCSTCNLEAIEESPVPRCKHHDPQAIPNYRPARIPHVPDIGDDGIIVFTREYTLPSLNFVRSHVLTTAKCGYCADTGVNDNRSAITRSRHSNVEQQDTVAAVQQVSP